MVVGRGGRWVPRDSPLVPGSPLVVSVGFGSVPTFSRPGEASPTFRDFEAGVAEAGATMMPVSVTPFVFSTALGLVNVVGFAGFMVGARLGSGPREGTRLRLGILWACWAYRVGR